MNYLFLIPGILIYAGTLCDLAYTTFSSNGAGYLTDALTKGMWRASLGICEGDGSKKILEYVGICTIGITVFAWFLLIWLGSTLIMLPDPASVVDATTNIPADTVQKIYYCGYTLTTMGNGDFKASGHLWQIFTVFLSFSGFMFITTAVTYMLPVLSADVTKKKISKKIFILGTTPQEILLNNYYKGGFHQLQTYLTDFTDTVITHSQQLLAYPILYSFHSAKLHKSAAISISVLDEVLTILLLHVPEENRPSNQVIAPLRKAIASFLNILDHNFTKDANTDTAFPTLHTLEEAGIELINGSMEKEKLYSPYLRRRELISVMLRNEGWQFEHIYKHKSDPEQHA